MKISTDFQAGRYYSNANRNKKAETNCAEGFFQKVPSASENEKTIEELPCFEFSYPPNKDCLGIDALTSEQIAQLKEKYNNGDIEPNSKEYEKFLRELVFAGAISEADYTVMVHGRPVSFDENGEPVMWHRRLDGIKTGEQNESKQFCDWLVETTKYFSAQYKKTSTSTDLSIYKDSLFYKSGEVACSRILDIIDLLGK